MKKNLYLTGDFYLGKSLFLFLKPFFTPNLLTPKYIMRNCNEYSVNEFNESPQTEKVISTIKTEINAIMIKLTQTKTNLNKPIRLEHLLNSFSIYCFNFININASPTNLSVT